MGLCLYAEESHFDVGSYTAVQQIRVVILRAYALALKSNGFMWQSEIVAETVEGDCDIRYGMFPLDFEDVDPATLAGINKWVNRSDCDGYLTPGDSLDVALMLDFVWDHLPESERDALFEFRTFLENAVQQRAVVRFR